MEMKEEWKGKMYTSLGSVKACGVTIMVKDDCVQNEKLIYRHKNGRLLVMSFDFCGIKFKLINLYAPNKEADRKSFFENLEPFCDDNCIVVGDFNVKMSRLDIGDHSILRNDTSRRKLEEIMNVKSLVMYGG